MIASGDYKVSIDKLEGPEDWAKWKWHISMVLCSYGLEDIINELVLTCKNAKEILDKLRARFERSSTQRLNMLIETFFRVKRDETEDISAHVAKLQKLFVDLNDELAKHEENYDKFKDLWDTIPTEKQSLNLLIEKLCTIELREQDINGRAAFVVSKTRKRQTSHWAAECPQNTLDSNKRKEKKRESEHAAFTSYAMGVCTRNHSDPNKWYCGSGATNHITPKEQYFVSYSEFDAPQEQFTSKFDETINGTMLEWTIVLYVPDASANLFSVRAIACRGYSTNFSYNNVCVRKQVNGNIVMTGYVKNGLYVLNMCVVRNGKMNQVNLMTSSETLQVYHERFGSKWL
ncbi:uncharacterized protein LOC126260519 [Schistocerca nitens]|uniref:uncharacterized protein LOC126260519 n=1 Tax=Schistocerca nitens TaxID=7011 RepID=UPI0021188BAB|nr:uncharacterized protein LOC126260519 [Schistocerca nitens]